MFLLKLVLPFFFMLCMSSCVKAEGLVVKQCDAVEFYDHTLIHRPIYQPCPSPILVEYEDIQLQHHQYIDFADYTNSVERENMNGLRLIGFVWIKVQGKFFLLPYYTTKE